MDDRGPKQTLANLLVDKSKSVIEFAKKNEECLPDEATAVLISEGFHFYQTLYSNLVT